MQIGILGQAAQGAQRSRNCGLIIEEADGPRRRGKYRGTARRRERQMNDSLYSKLTEMPQDDPRRVVPFDLYMTETLEASADIDFLGDGVYLLTKEKDSLIQENQALKQESSKIRQENSNLADLLRKMRFEQKLADTESWPPDDWTEFDDFDLFGANGASNPPD